MIKFEALDIKDGLSNNFVTCAAEDSIGFIWFGTKDGLNRYDGYTFKKYYYDNADVNSLSDNFITSIVVTHDGILWVGTAAGGICSFKPRVERWARYGYRKDSVESINDNRINTIWADNRANKEILWIGTAKGLSKFDMVSGKFKNYTLPGVAENNYQDIDVKVIYKHRNGVIWIGTDFGLWTFDVQNNRWQHFTNNSNDINSISDNKITGIRADKSGSLYIGTLDGLNKIEQVIASDDGPNKFSLSVERFGEGITKGFRGRPILSIYEDKEQSLWVGTYHGVNKICAERSEANYFNHDDNDPSSLSGNIINAIIQNKSGVMWFCTAGSGISKFNPSWSKFQHIRHVSGLANSLSGKSTRGIYVDDDGILWVGGYAGLNKINRETGSFEHYLPDNSEITTELVYAISADSSNQNILWLGSEGGGLIKFNKRTGKTTAFTAEKYIPNTTEGRAPSDNFIFDIHCDRNGILWLATRNGLNIYNTKTNIFKYYHHNKYDSVSIVNDKLRVIQEDNKGRIWIGTEASGVDVFDKVTETFKHIGYESGGGSKLGGNRILSIYQDSGDFIWVGTSGGGLTKIDYSNEQKPIFTTFTTKDGLPNNTIYGILEDEEQNLWLSTNLGLSKFNTKEATFENYFEEDGLQSNEFNSASYFKSAKGEMFFGGINGVNSFFPNSINETKYSPPIVLTGFKILNENIPIGPNSEQRTILKHTISYTKQIELLYTENVLTFEFAALSFTNEHNKSYVYRLDDFDNNWNYTIADSRVAHYTNIPPGEYTFRVKLADENGYLNNKDAVLRIIILPPWWNTWWAWLIYVFLFLAAIFFVRKYELALLSLKNKLLLEAEKSKSLVELDKMKTKFFTNISHEMKTPLSLLIDPIENLIGMQLGKKPTQILQIMKKNTLRIKEFIDQILLLNKLENKAVMLTVSQRDIIKDLYEIISMFRYKLKEEQININFETAMSSMRLFYNYDMIKKIFCNLISNAIKFTPKGGEISIRLVNDKHGDVKRKEGFVKISVKDTGRGIEEKKIKYIFNRFYQVHEPGYKFTEGAGVGLALVKESVELHKGTIEVISEVDEGTEFIINLPLGKSHLYPAQIKPEQNELETDYSDLDYEGTINYDQYEEDDFPGGSETIVLVIDDNPDMRSYLNSILIGNYLVIEADNGKVGLVKAIDRLPDLIISDVKMPEMDGLALCDKLKNDARTSHIPIIMLTAKTTAAEKIKGLKVGADAYIPKPFSSAELEVMVVNLIKQRRKLRKKFESQHEYKIKEIAVTPADEKFLRQIINSIEKHLSDVHFNVEEFRNELGFSKMQFIRKMKALTGKSPNHFMRNYRLQRAAQLIEQDFGSVSEVAYKVGFDNLNYFAKCFKEQFSCTASEYKKKRT